MSFQHDSPAQQPGHDMAPAVRSAFRAAHLITASVLQAEKAVLSALDRFDPDRDSQQILLSYAITAAIERAASEPSSSHSVDPVGLGAVLALPDLLRRCFVLRFLIRLSPSACARLLHLSLAAVDDYACAALHRLVGFEMRTS